MQGVLILISVLSFSLNSILTRIFQIKLQKSKYSINLYQALFSAVAAVAYLIVSLKGNISFSMHIILPAVMFGACFSGAVLFSARCMEMGYMSLTSVITNLSLILPVMFSWVVAKEPITINTIIGLILIIITLVLSSISAKSGGADNLKKWLLFVAIAFFANGGSAICQKQYQLTYGGSDTMLFMGAAYFVSALIFLGVFLKRNSKEKQPLTGQITSLGAMVALSVLSGLGSFAGNGLLGYLSDKVNGGILYPCINGGLSIVVSIASFLFFKEKLSNKKLAAIFTGVLAIILLNT